MVKPLPFYYSAIFFFAAFFLLIKITAPMAIIAADTIWLTGILVFQRRKTLVNSIANQSGLAITKEQIASVLECMGLDARVRGEALSITQFCELADRIEEIL